MASRFLGRLWKYFVNKANACSNNSNNVSNNSFFQLIPSKILLEFSRETEKKNALFSPDRFCYHE